MYIFCGDHLLVAKLKTADHDGAKDALVELKRVVARIRERWPETHILIRGDSGYCREYLMSWIESESGVDYVFGVARNRRLVGLVQDELNVVRDLALQTGAAVRTFKELVYSTLTSWSRERRVVAKVEHLPPGNDGSGKSNPRFVVTSYDADAVDARELYEEVYCARGDAENRIKEQQLGMFADRTSTRTLRGNQLRLWFSAFAYVLVDALRRIALVKTRMARAQVGTIRLRLLKIGTQIRQSTRLVKLAYSEAFPHHDVFRIALTAIHAF